MDFAKTPEEDLGNGNDMGSVILDMLMRFGPPTLILTPDQRKEVMEFFAEKTGVVFAPDVDLQRLCARTDGFSVAQLEALLMDSVVSAFSDFSQEELPNDSVVSAFSDFSQEEKQDTASGIVVAMRHMEKFLPRKK